MSVRDEPSPDSAHAAAARAPLEQLHTLHDIHRELLVQLSLLDKAGEHIVAAHLVGAIDALEYRIDSCTDGDGQSKPL